MRSTLLRAAALLLAVASAVLLVQLGQAAEPRPAPALLIARALTIAALFHAGLFLAPQARRPWHRVAAAAAMLPSALIAVSFAGQAVVRVGEGRAPPYLTTAMAVVGIVAYATAYWMVARRPWNDA